MLCVSSIRAVYFTEILLLVTAVSCAGSAALWERELGAALICASQAELLTSPRWLKSLAMMHEPGKHNLTFRSQAERAVLPAKENMDLAFSFSFFPPPPFQKSPTTFGTRKKNDLESC